MLWLAGLFFLAVRKLTKKIKNKKVWFLPYTMLAMGVFALAYAPLPFGWGTVAGLAGYCLNWVLGFVGSWIGVTSAVIAGLALVLVLIFGLFDLIKDHKPDGMAKTMVYAVPVLALVAAGPVAANVLHFTHLVSNVGPQIVSHIAG